MIPSEIKFDPNATPPQFTNNEDSVIEKGSDIRIKLKGIRSDVGNMHAVGTIKEDFLGYACTDETLQWTPTLICTIDVWHRLRSNRNSVLRKISGVHSKKNPMKTTHKKDPKNIPARQPISALLSFTPPSFECPVGHGFLHSIANGGKEAASRKIWRLACCQAIFLRH